jgi:hypothetical protein
MPRMAAVLTDRGYGLRAEGGGLFADHRGTQGLREDRQRGGEGTAAATGGWQAVGRIRGGGVAEGTEMPEKHKQGSKDPSHGGS